MMRVFCGEYTCTADAKGRMFVPTKIRERFGEGEAIILVRSLDPCISIYTEEKWKSFEEKIESLPGTEAREVKRFFYGSMQDAFMDAQGRLLIPAHLREYAGIEKQVLVAGCGDHAEIWSEETYRKAVSESRSEDIEAILRRNGL